MNRALCAGQAAILVASPPDDRQSDGDGAFWDLIYILYPETVYTAGLPAARDLVSSWSALEAALKVAACSAVQLLAGFMKLVDREIFYES